MKNFLKISFLALLSFVAGALFDVNAATVFISLLIVGLLPKEKNVLAMNNLDARMIFENAKAALARAFGYPPEADMLSYFKLTQNSLRLEQPIVAGQTLYTFPLLNNQGTQTSTEKRMKLQDTNVIYQVQLLLGVAPDATDAGHSKMQSLTYPNNQFFTGGTSDLDAYALYNGVLLMTINNDQVLTDWDTERHLYRGETQQTAAAGAGSPLDQYRSSFDGGYPMEPNVTLIGSKDNSIQIKLPTGGIATTVANSFIILRFRTILAQNSTVVS